MDPPQHPQWVGDCGCSPTMYIKHKEMLIKKNKRESFNLTHRYPDIQLQVLMGINNLLGALWVWLGPGGSHWGLVGVVGAWYIWLEPGTYGWSLVHMAGAWWVWLGPGGCD